MKKDFMMPFELIFSAITHLKNLSIRTTYGWEPPAPYEAIFIEGFEYDEDDYMGVLHWSHKGEELYMRFWSNGSCEIRVRTVEVTWELEDLPTDVFVIFRKLWTHTKR